MSAGRYLNPSPSGEGQGVGPLSKRCRPPTGPTPTPPLKGRGFALLLALALAACGKQEVLHPPQGASLPVKPAMAATQPTVDQLLTPSAQQRPGRSEELLLKSEERPDDRFDLPPPG